MASLVPALMNAQMDLTSVTLRLHVRTQKAPTLARVTLGGKEMEYAAQV